MTHLCDKSVTNSFKFQSLWKWFVLFLCKFDDFAILNPQLTCTVWYFWVQIYAFHQSCDSVSKSFSANNHMLCNNKLWGRTCNCCIAEKAKIGGILWALVQEVHENNRIRPKLVLNFFSVKSHIEFGCFRLYNLLCKICGLKQKQLCY